ncbi:hypothetical protein M404DRAFT_35241 [Pisolithus tinctorius Marx 270]|uniref:Uncharacterized protein n=1 Tax=Pisolithus tinctorius Marx 270 TaxID=870435 RepID=A0A0C3NEU8_PISTI|nr:hypothetical protein M404DRAFT_35241 [Pisolithus tinctorius Marx 270]
MAPKRDAPQPKEASVPKRMRTAAPSQTSIANKLSVLETASPARDTPPTTPRDHPACDDPDYSSTPSTDTLPSTCPPIASDVPAPKETVSSHLEESPNPPPKPTTSNNPFPSSVIPGTIATVGPPPDSRLFDPERISTCPEPLLKRIEVLSSYSNGDANTFALGHILPCATWGITDPYEDRSKILCNPKTNEPVNIWILGHITNTWFMKDGAPDSQCSVTVLPLSTRIGQYANTLLSKFSNPTLPPNEYDRGLIRAVRWQSPRSGGVSTLFNSIYDAREVLKTKSSMKKLDISYLEKRALVLLETHFNRYRQKDENGRWTISRTQFELQAIYLLQDPCLPDSDHNTDSGLRRHHPRYLSKSYTHSHIQQKHLWGIRLNAYPSSTPWNVNHVEIIHHRNLFPPNTTPFESDVFVNHIHFRIVFDRYRHQYNRSQASYLFVCLGNHGRAINIWPENDMDAILEALIMYPRPPSQLPTTSDLFPD